MRQSIEVTMDTKPTGGEPTLEKKGYAEPLARRVLLEALRGRGGRLTKADAITISLT